MDHCNTHASSSSYEVNNAFVAKAQCFTKYEYRQIMLLLNKDTKDCNQTNSLDIATYLMDNLFTHESIVDYSASYYVASIRHLLTNDQY